MRHGSIRHRSGLTLYEVMVCISLVMIVVGLALAGLFSWPRGTRNSNPMKNSSQLRGIHQSAVIFAQSNNYHLPGLDSSGEVLPDGPTTTGNSGVGSTVEARFWILLQGQFIPAVMLANPQESLTTMWTSNAVTKPMYSYAMLRIDSTTTDAGRMAEWKDNANSDAVFITDRNTGISAAPAAVQSLWTTTPGDWKGNIVWGDNHAEFSTTHTGLMTRYLSTSNTNDNLFLDERAAAGSNALMVR